MYSKFFRNGAIEQALSSEEGLGDVQDEGEYSRCVRSVRELVRRNAREGATLAVP